MNIGSFDFILVVALFGMIVVFGLLILLSAIMSGMQRADRIIPTTSEGATFATREERRAARKRAKSTAAVGIGPGADPTAKRALPNWVIPAAVAYLVLEEEDARPEASPWTTGRSFRGDPWLTNDFGDQT